MYNLLKAKISFPISCFISSASKYQNSSSTQKKTIFLEKDLFEELSKQGQLDNLLLNSRKEFAFREKTKLEEIIEKDDIDSFRIFASEPQFNQMIDKVNLLFQYTKVPILSYCIEKEAIKCFKYALINGADPSQKSQLNDEKVWDSYGFAGAIGNIQIIKMIEDNGYPMSKDLVNGCIMFHHNNILQWIIKEHPDYVSSQ